MNASAPDAAAGWKRRLAWDANGFYRWRDDATSGVEVRLFLTAALLANAEDSLCGQIVNATRFEGAKLVVITPDCHHGYGVPVGCVLLTEDVDGAIAMGPVGYDIGCGMMAASSDIPWEEATPRNRLAFNTAVMRRIQMGAGGKSRVLGDLKENEFERLVRGGAEYYIAKHGAGFDRGRAERDRLPVDDDWVVPWGGRGRPERGIQQLGSLGGGNHFIELQRCEETQALFVQVHTGSRGFGHGLATNYFDIARAEKPDKIAHLDLGYFTPDSPHRRSYLNAVAAGGNFAIINRLVIFEQVALAFREVFGADLTLVYEISHNLVQRELHDDLGWVWVHRKGATRALPAGHPALAGSAWANTGHPVLIPGSNMDYSYILRPLPGAAQSAYSVNHGAGRRMSRSAALKALDQKATDDEYRRAGILVNADGKVPIDEAAPCYKSSREVVDCVVSAGLAEVTHTLWPLASLKGTDEPRKRRRR
ncbi:MAG: RtcB family protein [Candidatus Eremiobacter antarcticus]|nr:RtcB family protein [Candidatus Eremiobacteraeota bacterium]MBC5809073.1 RtcB family protein [Candidatus Eremiobacteraeota bacterium]PZR64301.1 MAG: RtcB family protein [Candidatus Eremiobacter sp. RRmetagenome_bin22]